MDCSVRFNFKRLNYPQVKWAETFGVKEEWIVIDEVDKLANRTHMNSLHGFLGKSYPTPRHFILTANNLSRIPDGVIKRCEVLEIVAPAPTEYLVYAQSRLSAGGVMLADAPVLTFLETEMRNGDLRHVERRLDDIVIAMNTTEPMSIVVP
jgi:hypothetical protein